MTHKSANRNKIQGDRFIASRRLPIIERFWVFQSFTISKLFGGPRPKRERFAKRCNVDISI